MQIVFQDPYASSQPAPDGRARSWAEPLAVHERLDRAAARARILAMLERVGLGAAHLDRYPHQFSGGQRQRIGIARALVLRPDFVVCDEPVSALDVSIQAQILALLRELKEELGLTYLFIAHDLAVVAHLSDRVAVLYLGKIVELGPTRAVYRRSPHTPTPEHCSQPCRGSTGGAIACAGRLWASPLAGPTPRGCRFHPRCPHAMEVCRERDRSSSRWRPGPPRRLPPAPRTHFRGSPRMTRPSRVGCPIDLEAPGKRLGHLRVPHSSNRSAYGWIGVPIGVIVGGEGPTVYLGGGNHGDEYEGPITLLRLFQELEPWRVRGRLIVLPMTNLPAVLAYQRCSPIDGANLNRMFVGDPGLDHEPTKAIAHFVEEVLLPLCDAAIDLHSGGRTLDYVPSALARTGPDDPLRERKLAALRAFGAPVSYLVPPVGNDTGFLAASDRKGVLALGTELGGAGTVTPTTLAVARRGVLGFLAHLGVLDGVPEPGPTRIRRGSPGALRVGTTGRAVRAGGGPRCRGRGRGGRGLALRPGRTRARTARGPLRGRRPGLVPPADSAGRAWRLPLSFGCRPRGLSGGSRGRGARSAGGASQRIRAAWSIARRNAWSLDRGASRSAQTITTLSERSRACSKSSPWPCSQAVSRSNVSRQTRPGPSSGRQVDFAIVHARAPGGSGSRLTFVNVSWCRAGCRGAALG
jgi:predicted deacylase